MAVDLTKLENGITFEGKGGELFDALVIETIKQQNMMEDHKQYKSLLGYTDTKLLNPDEKFSSRIPNGGLKKITESGLKEKRTLNFGPKKGLGQTEYASEFTNTYLFTQWAKNATNLKGASDGVQAELARTGEETRDLLIGYDITYAENLVETLTKGFSITSPEGPGSACARDGLALFSASHELDNGTTFSNLLTGACYTDIATGTSQLQAMIDLLKAMKFDNGKKVKQGKMYHLFCSRQRETFWLSVINNSNPMSGQGTNSNQENVFNFRNNVVKVVPLDLLGDKNSDGVDIGTDNMVFLSNMKAVQDFRALRCAELYSPYMKTWVNDSTDEMNTSIRAIVGTGHYDAEFCIVGGTGVA